MTPERYKRIQALFLSIRELEETEQQTRLQALEDQTPEDAKVVRQLLAADYDGASFLKTRTGGVSDQCSVQHQRDTGATQDFLAPSSPDLPERVGQYRILQRIGEGGHGVVFMAEQSHPIRRRVAVKCVKPGMGSRSVLNRFEAERQALAMMSHPSIANVIDAGETESGQPFFVMELVRGIPIDQFAADNRLSIADRLILFRQVCDAVHHAHQKGVIHRDIKPANVLVTINSGRPLAKVIDFGIAKALHMPLTDKTLFTEFGQIVGTLEFMSPEQAMMSQEGADVRSDVYSLGALLYCLLTGAAPIGKETLLQKGLWGLRDVLLETQPPSPSLRMSQIREAAKWKEQGEGTSVKPGHFHGDLDWITMKALAKAPDERYESAAALSEDIENFMTGDSIVARPPSFFYSASKWVKRHRVATLMVGSLILSAIIAVVGLVFGFLTAQKNLSLAREATALADKRSEELQQSLKATERERARADTSANRLANRLHRAILESAWTHALYGDAIRARDALSEIHPQQRGFVWRFVDSVSGQMDWPSLRGDDEGAPRAFAIHPSTGALAFINTESLLEVWDLESQQRQLRTQLEPALYTAVAFSQDGDHLMVGRNGGVEKVTWRSGGELEHLFETDLNLGGIRAAVHDWQHRCWYVSTGANYLVTVDDTVGQVTAKVKLPFRINELALSEDCRYLAISASTTCFIISTTDGDSWIEVPVPTAPLSSLAWNSVGLVASSEEGDRLALTETRIKESLKKTSEGSEAGDALFEVTHSRDWIEGRPVDVQVASNGMFVINESNGRVSLVDFTSQRQVPVRNFEQAITSAMLLDSQKIVVVHFNGRINLVSDQDVLCRLTYNAGMAGLVDGVCGGRAPFAITGHDDGRLKRWNTVSGELESVQRTHGNSVLSLAVHESAGLIASVGTDWKIAISSMDNCLTKSTARIGLGVRSVTFSNDGRYLAAAPDSDRAKDLVEGSIDLWEVDSLTAVTRLTGHTNWVVDAQFFANDSGLVSIALDGTARVWDVASGDCEQTIDLSLFANAVSLQVNESSHEALVAHADGSISCWDLETGAMRLREHLFPGTVVGMVLVPGERCLVVAVEGLSVLTFLDPETLEVLVELEAGTGRIADLRADLMKQRLQILGEQGALRIWPLALTPNGKREGPVP